MKITDRQREQLADLAESIARLDAVLEHGGDESTVRAALRAVEIDAHAAGLAFGSGRNKTRETSVQEE